MKQVTITRREERALDALAATSHFWGAIRAKYAEYGALTERQKELFDEAVARNAWRGDAPTIDGRPVRNRFRTHDGAPRCAWREKPYCGEEATIVVATWGYCEDHADDARAAYAEWLGSHSRTKASA